MVNEDETFGTSGAPLLEGRVAVITGGGVGIGAAIVRRFVDHGAIVEVAEIDSARAEEIARKRGVRATTLDVRDIDAVDKWAEAVRIRHDHVDILVNNVGHYLRAVPFRQSDPSHWDALHEINLRHVFVTTRAFLPMLLAGSHSSIINVHSVEAMRGYPPDPVYAAYKAAVAHFTTSLAGELGRKGIRVNGIAPDLTQTPQVDFRDAAADALWEAWAPVGRVGEPEDQADVALFLASDLSRFVTGLNVPVDGGTHAYGGWFWSPSRRRFTNRPLNL